MYQLKCEDVKSITPLEVAFTTTRFLPEKEVIPREFTNKTNPYYLLALKLFHCGDLGEGEIGFKLNVEPAEVSDFVYAHLGSFEPSHEHKISGVAYMMSFIFEFSD